MMKKNSIQIGIPCGKNSELYVDFLIKTIESTISKKQNYEYILGVNQEGVDIEFLKNIPNAKVFVDIDNNSQSTGHGKCLDLILKNMTSDYGVFVDSDVAFIKKDWDLIFLSQIEKKCPIIGTEYHPTDGKIINFPNVITCFFDVEKIRSLNISFVPKLKRITVTEKDSKWYGLPAGKEIFLDTGCHIPVSLGEAGYSWKTMKIVSPRYNDRLKMLKFMKKTMRGEEYQLNGIPICTHVGRSLTRNFKKDYIVNLWKQRVKEWLNGEV